jgi:arylsulfatase A-like enzyme/Tfp pilus assembly protein PilF
MRSSGRTAALVGGAAIAALAAGAALQALRPALRPRWLGGGRPNLLVVTLDTLRADRVGCYGYRAARTPRLDTLAARGLRFAQATTVTPLTLPAHSSLFTGTFPPFHGVRDNGGFYLGEDQTTLAEMMRGRGYRTAGFVSAFVLDSRWGIHQGFDRYFDDFDLSKFEKAAGMDAIQRPGAETVDEALRWLPEDRSRPFFAWVHLYDPHAPYTPPAAFADLYPRTASGAYDAEIAATDVQVGRLLDALEAAGQLANTVVAVLADHGEMLGEHGEPTHGFFIYDAAVHIPLILAGPGIPAVVVADQVRIVDVMPTALELLGVAPPAAVQGVSLLPLARGQRLDLQAYSESWYPRYHYGWSELVSVQDGRFKLIRAPRPELYDLTQDPGELVDLSGRDARRTSGLRQSLEDMAARIASAQPAKGPQAIDAETAERLEALGYVGGAISARHLEDRPRGDPKDKIQLYNLLKDAGGDSAQGRYDDAIAKVQKALAADPEILEGHMLLGNFLRKSQRPEEAIHAYRRALALDPEHQETLFLLALTYKEAGRAADARVGFTRAHELDPRNGRVLWQLADLDMREGHFDQAQARLEQALALKVEEGRFLLKLGECHLEAKRYDEAEAALRKALAARADLETAHFSLGLVYEERGEVDRAIAAYEAELKTNPKGYRASFNLAKLLQRRGRLPEAVRRFQQTVTITPEFGTGHLYLAKALLDAGDLEGAERSARAGLQANADSKIAPLGHYVLADVFNRRGRSREAAREAAAARRLERAGLSPRGARAPRGESP